MEKQELQDLQVIKQTILEYGEDKETLLKFYELYIKKWEIYKQLQVEKHHLEKKYEEKFQPILNQRTKELDKKTVDYFWLKSIKNNPLLCKSIVERDAQVLKFLRNIKAERHSQDLGFTLTFEFWPNEYIENTSLTKRYIMPQEGIIRKIEGSNIQWKQQNLTLKTIQKKQKNKKTNETRVIIKMVETESFFNFFKSIDHSKEGAKEPTEEEFDYMERDLKIGQEIMEEIIPHALTYYLGLRETDESMPQNFVVKNSQKELEILDFKKKIEDEDQLTTAREEKSTLELKIEENFDQHYK